MNVVLASWMTEGQLSVLLPFQVARRLLAQQTPKNKKQKVNDHWEVSSTDLSMHIVYNTQIIICSWSCGKAC